MQFEQKYVNRIYFSSNSIGFVFVSIEYKIIGLNLHLNQFHIPFRFIPIWTTAYRYVWQHKFLFTVLKLSQDCFAVLLSSAFINKPISNQTLCIRAQNVKRHTLFQYMSFDEFDFICLWIKVPQLSFRNFFVNALNNSLVNIIFITTRKYQFIFIRLFTIIWHQVSRTWSRYAACKPHSPQIKVCQKGWKPNDGKVSTRAESRSPVYFLYLLSFFVFNMCLLTIVPFK